MSETVEQESGARRPRADGARNRRQILTVAKEVFTRRGADASMDEIAKRAGVGPGTLYRHFASRDQLLAAVYISEVEHLCAAQVRVCAELAPLEAFREWLLVFIDYVATKKLILPQLNAMSGGPLKVFAETNRMMVSSLATLTERCVASGDLRADVDAMSLLQAIYAVAIAGNADEAPAKARQLAEILLRGSRP